VQQIADWLQNLGMSEYTRRFVENDIDISVLSHLTDQDLKELGVSLGHRRKILAAIAELAPGAVPPSPPSAATESKLQEVAERRQVTVMFSDLVGSTILSARMDPEDLREVIADYHRCVAEIVRSSEGFVAQYLGDGVLVYFGYPQAHEDDVERAVRAGLDLIGAVSSLKTRAPLQARVGIATGIVVVGDRRGIVGETPNLAARLQGIAEPNRVVIAESTRKLLGNLFELEDLGSKDLKGFTEPVRIWTALRASSMENRFEALHAGVLTALVGREEESELLRRRWARAKVGDGQVPQRGLCILSIGRIDEHGHTSGCWHQLAQKLQPLCSQFSPEKIGSRQIASRPSETGDKTTPDRVVADVEDDGDRRRCRLGR
jgi:class 3 adenylate cyclase